jgi:tripartite-type tricarboxylate transporter receptor subunit TctC
MTIRYAGLIVVWFYGLALLPAHAQDRSPYPSKPLRLFVSTAPGAPPDLVARLLGEKLASSLGQPVLVENRPGAAGTIGMGAVAKAAADGYTLGVLSMAYLTAPSLIAKMPYDTEKDLAAVSLVARDSNLFVVPSSSPAKSVAELVALAKSKPGLLKFASGGNGTPAHLAGELFKREAGVDITHIPYKGPVAGATALMSGEVEMMFGATAAMSPHIKSGRLRPLAASTPNRIPAYSNLPTMVELGFANVSVANWFGFVAPAGTRSEVVSRLDVELQRIGAMPEVRQRLEAIGLESAHVRPEEFAAFIRSESRKWSKVAREAGLKPD